MALDVWGQVHGRTRKRIAWTSMLDQTTPLQPSKQLYCLNQKVVVSILEVL